MLENSALYSRLLFAFALVCAAVMSFIMCSDAARASPTAPQVDSGVKDKVLRRLHTPYSHRHPLSTALLSADTGSQTGINSETETRGDYRQALSIINHQSKSPQLPGGSFVYDQNFPDNRHAQAGMTKVQSEVRPRSSIFRNHLHQHFAERQSGGNYHLGTGNSYNSHPLIIRKSSYKEAASPFPQSSRYSQVWEPRDAQKSYNVGKVPRNDPPNVLKDQTVWQPTGSLFTSQISRYRSTPPPTSRGHYSGYKETTELPVAWVQSPSSGIQSNKFRGFASETAPRAPSITNSLDASVIKSDSSPEKLRSSITDFSHSPHLVSSSETPRLKKLQSYLFKDPQVSFVGHKTVNAVTGDGPNTFSTTQHRQRPPDAQVYSRFSSNFNRSQRDPTQEVKTPSNNAKQLYRTTNGAQFGAQTGSFNKYQHATVGTLAKMSVHPDPGRDDTMKSFVPVPHDTGSDKSVVSSLASATARGSAHPYKPGRTIKSIYVFRGRESPELGAVKEPSVVSSGGSKEKTTFLQYSFDKGKFEIANTYRPSSPKYMFGQIRAQTPTSTPAELKWTPADYASPSPGTSDIVQTSTTPSKVRVISRFKEPRPVILESHRDSNPDRKPFRIYRRPYGLKGYGTRPLEGAKTSDPEPDKSATVRHDFEGFKLAGSQIWQQKSRGIHGWSHKIGETEPDNSHVFTVSQNEQSSEDLEPLLKTTGSPESRFRPIKYKNSRNMYSSLGFRPVQNITGNSDNKNPWKYKKQHPTTATESQRISSAYLRLAGDFRVESSPKSDMTPPTRTKPVEMRATLLSSSTSSTVRGKRVKGKHTNGKKLSGSTFLTNGTIIRLPKMPARYKAVTYADILGSASFSSVSAVTPTTITPPDKDYSLGATATTRQEEREGHQTPPVDGEDFSSVKENKLVVGNEEAESDVKTSDFFLDNEGSGSGGFNISDALSADTTKDKGRSEDLLALNYPRTSTGNISFKSINQSPSEK